MKIQLVLFAIAGTILGHTSALGDGLNFLNAKNMYDQISSQVRVPFTSETSGVRSVMESMKDLQKRFQVSQSRNLGGFHDDGTTRRSQLHHQSQDRFSSETAVPLNRRDEFIQINERIAPSSHYIEKSSSIAVNPSFLNEKLLAVDRHGSFDDRRQYHNQQQTHHDRQLEEFNRQHSYDSRQQPGFPHYTYNNKQQESTSQKSVFNSNQEVPNAQQSSNNKQPSFPQGSYDRQQETIVQRSYKKESLLPRGSYDDRQQAISSQRSFNDKQQETINQRAYKQESLLPRGPYDDRQQAVSSQRSFNDKRQETITQRSNNNEPAINQQRQFHNDGKLSIPQLANNDQLQAAEPQQLPESRPEIYARHQFNRNMEVNENGDQRSFHVSSQIYNSNGHITSEPNPTGEQFGFEKLGRSVLISKDTIGHLSDQNEDSKIVPLIPTVIQNSESALKETDSRRKGEASVRHHMKTPYTDYNFSHLL